ncbi:MAG: vanadium-dependent haloperoxidase [Gemmatimonadaceae bacterium]|nr:vanadium-dependent haloperoxidase [Acetobacteraceae bacterium]
MLRFAALRRAMFAAILLAGPAQAADQVTEWTLLGDQLGRGGANWRSLAIMHQAMHDAGNAALPVYERWFPASADEKPVAMGVPQAAMAAAAMRVLVSLHPAAVPDIDRLYRAALARLPDTPDTQASAWLGDTIGRAAVARRDNDGFEVIKLFPKGDVPGRWRPAPADFSNSNTTETRPFLFASDVEVPPPPPPPAGSPRFLEGIAEARRIGGADSADRTAQQSETALYWAYQSSQRGYMHLAVRLLDQHPRRGQLAEHARIMSQMATAMADSAVLSWLEKERFTYWRPITAIRTGGPGFEKDEDWEPLIATPPHPEYPSGHASDCFTGSGVLQAAFGELTAPVTYVAQRGQAPEDNVGMGQHIQYADSGLAAARQYPSLAAMAEDCSNSRIWAGAHIRAANEESRRLGALISGRAAAKVPALP